VKPEMRYIAASARTVTTCRCTSYFFPSY